MKPGRGYTDNGEVLPVQTDGLPQDLWVAMETVLPHLVADYRDRVGTRLVPTFFREKRPPQDRLDLQYIEVICRYQFSPGALCFPFIPHAEWCESRHRQPGNQRQVVTIIAVIEIRGVD